MGRSIRKDFGPKSSSWRLTPLQHILCTPTLTVNGVFFLHWNQFPPGFHIGIRGPWHRLLERQCPIAPTKPWHKRCHQTPLMEGLRTLSLWGCWGRRSPHPPGTPIVSKLWPCGSWPEREELSAQHQHHICSEPRQADFAVLNPEQGEENPPLSLHSPGSFPG